ncbi:protein translocase subunit SecY [Reticulibacter mediterranei]|uniref:Protein translocase subunit SecY n=1 Tax=Reticulibacter mediterranei TaxID=2778369 RepID=A0A8J3N0R1_9CHLR|nr:preprotein translocase subunit SecY [Reticulibacter mediterranei]GHO91465.1 protein translocase subunit SecY [Reticulibacter mediterranei]
MWEKIQNFWAMPDLRNKLLFTLGMLFIFRVLANIPVPLSAEGQRRLIDLFAGRGDAALGQLLGLLDTFSGGSLQRFSIVALSIYPYITATIVTQLLIPIIPAWRERLTEGETGKQLFSRITRLMAVPLAFLQGIGQLSIFVQAGIVESSSFTFVGPAWLDTLSMLATLVAGTMILVWLGELITEYGVGNGISIIIFAGIVSTLPSNIQQDIVTAITSGGGGSAMISLLVSCLLGLLLIVGMIYLYLGQKRIIVRYPTKRRVGKDLLVGAASTTYIPMQVNSVGMVPLIFASSTAIFPALLARYLTASPVKWLSGSALWISTYLANTRLWSYWVLYFVLVVAFTYFYTFVQWEQQRLPEMLQKQGAVIPGQRPGVGTEKYLLAILKRLTLVGALSLGVAAVLPLLIPVGGLDSTKLLIVVGVVLDTVRQVNAHMQMRTYKGLLS